MQIEIRPVEIAEILPFRELYRHAAHCQLVHDSITTRGWTENYLILVEGSPAAYGAVWKQGEVNRLIEFHALPAHRGASRELFRQLLAVSGATHLEAQTNVPEMLTMLYDCGKDIEVSSVLFEDDFVSRLPNPGGVLRRVTEADKDTVFEHKMEPIGEWCLERDGEILGTAGAYYHYNPPYGDVHMEVAEEYRWQGIGCYLIQEVKRACYEIGKIPGARCNPANIGSRRTLERAGFRVCGRMLVGEVELGRLGN